MNKVFGKKNGITLISLVITIVIMLILAAVSINLIIGDNGLFKKAQTSAETYEEKKVQESIELVLAEKEMSDDSQNQSWKDFLLSKVSDELDEVTGEGPFEVIKDSYLATIDINGKIIDIQKVGPNIQVDNIKVVANEDGIGENLGEATQEDGATVYITFDHSMVGGTTTVDKTLPYGVIKNGRVEFNVTGTLNNNTYTKKVIVDINQFAKSLKVGTYINYDVPYKDMYTGYNYTSEDGWRVLDLGHDNNDGTYSNAKIVSTGIPAKLNYNYDYMSNATSWKGTADQIQDYIDNIDVGDAKNYNMLAVAGLYYNFAKIPFNYGTAPNENCTGCFEQVNGKTSGSLALNEFIKNGATDLHELTLAEVNDARNKKAGSTQFALKTSEMSATEPIAHENDAAYGLFYMKDLYKYKDISFGYWLATPGRWSTSTVYYINNEGNIRIGTTEGVRPVVTIPTLSESDIAGK